MTQDNPHFDPGADADGRGTQEDLTHWERDSDSQSTPSIYEDPRGISDDDPFGHRPTCQNCDEPLQPSMKTCPACGSAVSAALAGMAVTAGTEYEYTIDRAIFAIVPALSKSLAKTRARGIFKARDDAPPRDSKDQQTDPENSFDIFEADDTPTSVMQTWGELPEAVRLDTPDGRALIERVTDVVEDPSTQSYVSSDHPHLYGRLGATLSVDETRALVDTSPDGSEEYWVVSAIAYVRKRSPPDSAHDLFCHNCEEETSHVFDGRDGSPPTVATADHDGAAASGGVPVEHLSATSGDKGRPVWQCFRCSAGRHGPSPSEIVQEMDDDHATAPQKEIKPHEPDGAPHLPEGKTQHDVVLERLENSDTPVWNRETSADTS